MARRMEASPQGRPGPRSLTRSYLVRHGEAGDRHAWHDPDELRPLTEEGWRQAKALVDLLADAEIDRLLSSPYVRCVQTLEPLAEARGLPVETTPVLAEGGKTRPFPQDSTACPARPLSGSPFHPASGCTN